MQWSNRTRLTAVVVWALASLLPPEAFAERVEEAYQLDYLRTEGCPIAQGFHFSHPLPADELSVFRRELMGTS